MSLQDASTSRPCNVEFFEPLRAPQQGQNPHEGQLGPAWVHLDLEHSVPLGGAFAEPVSNEGILERFLEVHLPNIEVHLLANDGASPHLRDSLARIYAKLHGMLALSSSSSDRHCDGESSEECKPTRKREREPTEVDEETASDCSVCPRGGVRTHAVVETQRSTKTYPLHNKWGRMPGNAAVEVRANVCADSLGSCKYDCCKECACRVLFELRRAGANDVISLDHPRKTLEQAGLVDNNSESWKKFAPLTSVKKPKKTPTQPKRAK